MIDFDITPMGAVRSTQKGFWKPNVLRYSQWKKDLAVLAKKKKYTPSDELSVHFFLPMPKSWSKKKRQEMRNTPHQSRPDLDNLIKAFLDALLEEDSSVYRINAKKLWDEEGYIYVL